MEPFSESLRAMTAEILAEIWEGYERTRMDCRALKVMGRLDELKDEPSMTVFEILSTGFFELGIDLKRRLWGRFGRSFLGPNKGYEARCAAFWDREWPLLDGSQQEEARRAFQNLSEDLQSSFNAWLENIGAKMGIPNVGNKGRKNRSAGGIEGFLRALKKDLKEKGT